MLHVNIEVLCFMEVKWSEEALLLVQADQSPPGLWAVLSFVCQIYFIDRLLITQMWGVWFFPPASDDLVDSLSCAQLLFLLPPLFQSTGRTKTSGRPAGQPPWLHTPGLNEPGRRVDAGKHKCRLTSGAWQGGFGPGQSQQAALFEVPGG